jgi:hypothetical protein
VRRPRVIARAVAVPDRPRAWSAFITVERLHVTGHVRLRSGRWPHTVGNVEVIGLSGRGPRVPRRWRYRRNVPLVLAATLDTPRRGEDGRALSAWHASLTVGTRRPA